MAAAAHTGRPAAPLLGEQLPADQGSAAGRHVACRLSPLAGAGPSGPPGRERGVHPRPDRDPPPASGQRRGDRSSRPCPGAAGVHGCPRLGRVADGFALRRADCRPATGVTDFGGRTVTVRADVDGAQAAKTLAHELAHVLLHDGTENGSGCRGRAEVEAESVAYSLIWTGGPC